MDREMGTGNACFSMESFTAQVSRCGILVPFLSSARSRYFSFPPHHPSFHPFFFFSSMTSPLCSSLRAFAILSEPFIPLCPLFLKCFSTSVLQHLALPHFSLHHFKYASALPLRFNIVQCFSILQDQCFRKLQDQCFSTLQGPWFHTLRIEQKQRALAHAAAFTLEACAARGCA